MNKDEMIEDLTNFLKNQCDNTPDEDCVGCDCNECETRALINAGYRKVGEDEIVLTKSEYENLRLAQYNAQTTINENFLLALEKIEQAKKETAREIINMLTPPCKTCDANWHKGCMCLQKKIIKQLAQKYGIELED